MNLARSASQFSELSSKRRCCIVHVNQSVRDAIDTTDLISVEDVRFHQRGGDQGAFFGQGFLYKEGALSGRFVGTVLTHSHLAYASRHLANTRAHVTVRHRDW
jgi:hypothetical protein